MGDAQPLPGTLKGTRGSPSRPLVRSAILSKPRPGPMSYPDAPFRHLQRLTDNIGLPQHADGVVPRYADGYRVEDVARGLLVACREPSPSHELIVLSRRYLYFLTQAQVLGGKFRNHLAYDRQWRGPPGTEDGWGCS